MIRRFMLFISAGFILLLAACNGRDMDSNYFPVPDRELQVIYSESQSFRIDTVLTDLNRPWSMEFLPDGIVLITERQGNVLVVNNGILQDNPLEGNIPSGLRDIRIHPQFEDNRWIYISYYVEPVENDGGYTRLMRGRFKGNRLVDEETIYSAGPLPGRGEWTGSRIAFDRAGYLYFAVGIRGERMNAQDISNHSGKTMRLHDDGTIPSDNPFVDTPDALPEIYTYGHREHQGLVLHPVTGEIWSNEHGERGGDEVNILRSGLNYGWPKATYSLEYDGTFVTEDTLRKGMEPPVHHWTPAIAPSGMDFVTGSRFPGWDGDLFSGSLVQRMLNRSVVENGEITGDEKLLEHIGRVRNVKIAPDGYLYLITEDTGLMVRLLPGN